MKFKRLSVLLTLMLAFSTFFTTFAFAEENIDKPNLVALGDSITFGLNLEAGQTKASPNAFPSLIADGEFDVTNTGVPGLTSLQLAAKLSNPDEGTILALKSADIFTLYIGGNDLLQATGISQILKSPVPVNLTPEQQIALVETAMKAAEGIAKNLQDSIDAIRLQNEHAPIILYNLYNPIPDIPESVNPFIHGLHILGNQIINGVNTTFINPIENREDGIFLADAYTPFNGNQAQLMIPGDVHPNLNGHQALAEAANAPLGLILMEEVAFDLSPATTEETTGPISIEVLSGNQKVLAMRWLESEKPLTAEAFYDENGSEIGNVINENKFEVTENGTYYVYMMDSLYRESVSTITIKNIKLASPTPTPVPTPTPAPTPVPTPVTSAPVPQVKATGYAIPNTASPAFNFVAVGSVVLLAGFVTLQVQRRRRQDA
ncbi:GDSL-type esterase/lipase family protein [Neobacillus niacini]|uniref:GDSL-type esterase/lipase family protein n=1 Tax=Neobacillus niacini TaxID=86668 RepID=UPI002559C078|nr:GDSL-type esterase/lipase family protein [Neobacillus niacini]